jgi:hypothetical protein
VSPGLVLWWFSATGWHALMSADLGSETMTEQVEEDLLLRTGSLCPPLRV